MIEIKRLPEFDEWLDGIKDNMTRIRLNRRLDKVQRGNWGEIKPLREGVWEMKETFGAGWRMYYIQHGGVVIVMLGGSEKSALTHALGVIAKARGMTQIAKEAGIGREALYKALRHDSSPRFDTINRVVNALGLKITVQHA